MDTALLLLVTGFLQAAPTLQAAACPAAREALHKVPVLEGHGFAPPPAGRPACGPRAAAEARLAGARTLLVQFQRLTQGVVDRLDPDVLVVDDCWDGDPDRRLSRWDVRRLRWRWSGPPRLVLAYVSVGEAEDYRYYWNGPARRGAAPFLDRPNPQWPGNFAVRFWDPGWRAILFGRPGAWIDRIVQAGFDGVYLDTVDAAESWVERGRADAPERMADLVRDLARHARSRDPAFLVVASNPFPLLGLPGVAAALSGIVAEDHVMRGEAPARPAALKGVLPPLRESARSGIPVMLIDYPRTPAGRERYASLCASEGFLCYAGVRALDRPGTLLPRGERKEVRP